MWQQVVSLLLFLSSTLNFSAGQKLLNLRPQDDRSLFKGCSQISVETCTRADLNIDLLKTGDSIELPDGTKLMLSQRDQNSAVFQVLFHIQF